MDMDTSIQSKKGLSPDLSIIVPVYNVERYLSECIDSILASTFIDYELILVDDGSTDASGKICDEYAPKNSRIRVFHKQNGGASSARNKGLDVAQAFWITFIDADDKIEPKFLESLYTIVKTNPDIDFVQAGCTNYIRNSKSTIMEYFEYKKGNDKRQLLSDFRGLSVSKFYKKDIIKKYNIKFDEKLFTAEDFLFALDYICHVDKYVFSSEVGYLCRRDNMKSLTHVYKNQPYNISLYMFKKRYESMKSYLGKNHLKFEDGGKRTSQLASLLVFAIYQLYDGSLDSSKRINHLREDFTKDYYSLYVYCEGYIDKMLFYLLSVGWIKLFDQLTVFVVNNRGIIHNFGKRLVAFSYVKQSVV